MRAIAMTKPGDIEVLQTISLARPIPKAKQVLLQNLAIAIEPYDCHVRSGKIKVNNPLPLVLGSSLAGRIHAVGEKVTDLKVGQRVAASPHFRSYAEYTAVGRSQIALIPDNVTDIQAAAVALSGQTAWQLAEEILGSSLSVGALLINGASGNVGQILIQLLADHFSKIYVTTGSTSAAKLKRQFPQVEIVNSTTRLSPIVAIIDLVGNQAVSNYLKYLTSNGLLWSTVKQYSDRRCNLFSMKSNGQSLEKLLTAVAQSQVKVQIARVAPFNLKNLRHFQILQHQFGKLVLKF
ncbi:NADP-dependent oxidoreductase [Liquorilactobacillus vini]|uniref:Zinc-binding oxidoreductase n=1 Tax=Liquorilactobacillus vini DSM 20605 TaxID=1133569 RepID=A0A0R2CD98_9LACO|nr:NADP-dependent oxidoreductase [Liquorilactobacillus vini]KRM89527.1 zinc-binding oxidoreductase [Liquorilactobacillus vini DSM 20605]